MRVLAKTVSFDGSMSFVGLVDGRQLGVPLNCFPRLMNATAEQRAAFVISGGGVGIHWPELDEDLLVAGLLTDKFK